EPWFQLRVVTLLHQPGGDQPIVHPIVDLVQPGGSLFFRLAAQHLAADQILNVEPDLVRLFLADFAKSDRRRPNSISCVEHDPFSSPGIITDAGHVEPPEISKPRRADHPRRERRPPALRRGWALCPDGACKG